MIDTDLVVWVLAYAVVYFSLFVMTISMLPALHDLQQIIRLEKHSGKKHKNTQLALFSLLWLLVASLVTTLTIAKFHYNLQLSVWLFVTYELLSVAGVVCAVMAACGETTMVDEQGDTLIVIEEDNSL